MTGEKTLAVARKKEAHYFEKPEVSERETRTLNIISRKKGAVAGLTGNKERKKGSSYSVGEEGDNQLLKRKKSPCREEKGGGTATFSLREKEKRGQPSGSFSNREGGKKGKRAPNVDKKGKRDGIVDRPLPI